MIIGIVGLAGSGKGAVSDWLVNESGLNFKKESFADPVKDAVSCIFGWPRNLLEGDTEESRAFREQKDSWWSERFGYDVTPRLMLQYMGTEAGRNVFHNDLWVISLENRIIENAKIGRNTVISDVRFPNEMKKITAWGGILLEIKRGKVPPWYRDAEICNLTGEHHLMKEKWPGVHYSEWAHIGQPIDRVIYNDGTLEELYSKMGIMLPSLVNLTSLKSKTYGENNEIK